MRNILHNIVLFTPNKEKIVVNHNNLFLTTVCICYENNKKTAKYYVNLIGQGEVCVTKTSWYYLHMRMSYFAQLYKYKNIDF